MSPWTSRHDYLVLMKREAGKSIYQISKEIKQTAAKVIASHERQGLKPIFANPKKAPPKREERKPQEARCALPTDPTPLGGFDGENPVFTAELTLGKRLEWRLTPYGYIQYLDGTPCDTKRKITEANRVRKDSNQPQLSRNPEWWV